MKSPASVTHKAAVAIFYSCVVQLRSRCYQVPPCWGIGAVAAAPSLHKGSYRCDNERELPRHQCCCCQFFKELLMVHKRPLLLCQFTKP
ncbi:hypothetical protein ZEAMMB73_Zm00001d010577 [Zea mays]|uniref:Uncharacterized protein n=1 Tax=Zea mays TaxID=4577 RepID=A0A1D6FS57_MAIZE|nr:hypothetical protein ZEAMMB73_Zm00001d010577 [Zea mays]AQK94396.1 hypothetical protein ZEAMMB73_Zm00001d010577 [Zea mays]